MTGYLAFPYRLDVAGRTATTDLPGHVEGLVLLVLQTDPGERVNRPEFGAGLKSLVFAGMDGALASAAETLIRGKLLQYLGDVITIQSLTATLQDDAARVALRYVVTHTGQRIDQVVVQSLAGAGAGDGRRRGSACCGASPSHGSAEREGERALYRARRAGRRRGAADDRGPAPRRRCDRRPCRR